MRAAVGVNLGGGCALVEVIESMVVEDRILQSWKTDGHATAATATLGPVWRQVSSPVTQAPGSSLFWQTAETINRAQGLRGTHCRIQKREATEQWSVEGGE